MCFIFVAHVPFLEGEGKCQALTKQQGICTDVRHPYYSSTIQRCPINCAKANGAVVTKLKQHDCLKTCKKDKPPRTCTEWVQDAFTVGGCGVLCPPAVKLEQRPRLSCKFTFKVGARVQVSSGVKRCVVAVNEENQQVVVGGFRDETSSKYSKYPIAELLLVKETHKRCPVPQEASLEEVKSTSLLTAVIDGPRQVSTCDKKITINSYKSTNSGPLSELRYRWKVPKADLAALSKKQRLLNLPALKFKSLSAGDHIFGLEVSNKAGATSRSSNFTVSVVRGPSPKVDLSCPPSSCTRTVDGVYEIEVNLREKTILELDVQAGANCGSQGSNKRGELRIEWEQSITATKSAKLQSQAGHNNWQPVQLGKLVSKNRRLSIAPRTLSPCVPTELRVTAEQSIFKSKNVLLIKLKPRRVSLVAKLKTDVSRVGYDDEVVLRASNSYDPLAKFYGLKTKQVS